MGATQRTVAVVQSNYIPWRGYFDLIGLADAFILYDTVQYTVRDWRNRNRIKTAAGPQWLTIPVQVTGRAQTIRETQTVDAAWRKRHWETLRRAYGRAAHWPDYREALERLYLADASPSLSVINRRFIEAICGWLGIRTTIRDAAEPDFAVGGCAGDGAEDRPLTGAATEERRLTASGAAAAAPAEPPTPSSRLLALVRAAGATVYLSGPAARAYLDEAAWAAAGVRVQWMDYGGYPEYRQLWPPFDPQVSVLDLILNEGPDAPRFMKFAARRA